MKKQIFFKKKNNKKFNIFTKTYLNLHENYFTLIILCLLLFVTIGCDIREKLDNIIKTTIKTTEYYPQTGVGVSVIKDGKLIFAKGYGYRNREKKLPFNKETLYSVGSTTKAFTAFTLLQLADRGLLNLDDPVKKYLNDFELKDPEATNLITSIDILAHRTGMPSHDDFWYLCPMKRYDYYSRLRYLEDDSTNPFRKSFIYNNLMYMTAGILVERISGKQWEEFVHENIFIPLSMTNSNIDPDRLFTSDNYAAGYFEGEPMPYYNKVSLRAVAPSGAINSNIIDMAKWIAMFLSNGKNETGKSLLSPKFLKRALRVENTHYPYGLGWEIIEFQNFRYVHHFGGVDGYNALVSFIPEHNIGVVVLVNEYSTTLNHHIAKNIYKYLLKDKVTLSELKQIDDYFNISSKGFEFPPKSPPLDKIELKGTEPIATFDHPAYGKLQIYETIGKEDYAVLFHGRIFPAYQKSATEWYMTTHTWGFQNEIQIDAILNHNGTDIIALAIPMNGDVKTPSIFLKSKNNISYK